MSSKDPKKARRAAAHPRRPGAQCRAEPGSFIPVVDRQRCEGKADCIAVCPYDIFEIGPIDEAEFRQFSTMTRFKLWVHGKKTALTPRAAECLACGMCVVACPENAISLVPKSTAET